MSSNEQPSLTLVNSLQDRYRIVAKLGSGGMADVFLGIQLGEEAFQRLVVIKRIHSLWLDNQSARKMFISEARLIASLSHPHIVKIFDLSKLRKDICIVMEYVDGENLDYIRKLSKKQKKSIPLPIVCKWMVEACNALHYAHTATSPEGKALNLVHRDIGPHNLMTDKQGYLKVIDFGIAKSTARSDLTTPGMIKGKFSYLSPDLFQHESIDGRADLYSLGLVFYELLSGKRCFSYKKDVAVAEVLRRVTTENLPPPSQFARLVPPALDKVVMKALEKDREKRFQTGSDFAEAIRAAAAGFGGLASSSKVADWMETLMGERIRKRRQFEIRAMEKAKAMISKVDFEVGSGMDTGTFKAAMDQASITGLSQFRIQHSSSENVSTPGSVVVAQTTKSRTNPYILLVLGFILFAGGAFLVHNLFFSSPSKPPADKFVVPGASVLVHADQHDAKVFLDDKEMGVVGESGLSLKLKAGKHHKLILRKDGYKPYQVSVVGKKGVEQLLDASLVALAKPAPDETGTKLADAKRDKEQDHKFVKAPVNDRRGREKSHKRRKRKHSKSSKTEKPTSHGRVMAKGEGLDGKRQEQRIEPESKPEPEPKVEPKEEAKPEPEPKIEPKPEVDKKPEESPEKVATIEKPQVSLLSGGGNWPGKKVAQRGCTHCHNGGKAPKLRWNKKSARQWKFFFRRKRHNRHARLDDLFSKKELKAVLAYIISQLSDDEKSGIAGVK